MTARSRCAALSSQRRRSVLLSKDMVYDLEVVKVLCHRLVIVLRSGKILCVFVLWL